MPSFSENVLEMGLEGFGGAVKWLCGLKNLAKQQCDFAQCYYGVQLGPEQLGCLCPSLLPSARLPLPFLASFCPAAFALPCYLLPCCLCPSLLPSALLCPALL